MSKTFPVPYLTERLKLGDNVLARSICEGLGTHGLTGRECGLTLSFAEDRALTAIQVLFAFSGFKPQESVALTPEARETWGCSELPVVIFEVSEYCRHYAQMGKVAPDLALAALRLLASRTFYLAYRETKNGPLRCLHAPVLAVQKYKCKGQRRPTHLRIALTPVLYQGVYPEVTGFRAKMALHARLLTGTPKGGRPPEVLLRLTSWLLTLSQPVTQVTERKLAERLRSRALENGQPGKFCETLQRHFEVARELGLLESFTAPSKRGGTWQVKRPREHVELLSASKL